MKVTYEFTFEEGSEDSRELYIIQNSRSMLCALSDLAEKFRSWNKWDERGAIPTEEIKDTFYDILEENDVNLDKLIY